MRKLGLLLVFPWVLAGCNSVSEKPVQSLPEAQSFNVKLSKYSPEQKVTTFANLPSGACSGPQDLQTCTISPDVAIKWGAGFCDSSKQRLDFRVAASEIRLYVDNQQVPTDLVTRTDVTLGRATFQHCHTWLITLSDWQAGKVQLKSKNGGYLIEIKTVLVVGR